MNKQTIILIFLLIITGLTLLLYIWKAKKECEYKSDERWQMIQNKANKAANHLNDIVILFLAIGEIMLLFYDIQTTFTLNQILTYGIVIYGIRNTIEFFSLIYFDRKL